MESLFGLRAMRGNGLKVCFSAKLKQQPQGQKEQPEKWRETCNDPITAWSLSAKRAITAVCWWTLTGSCYCNYKCPSIHYISLLLLCRVVWGAGERLRFKPVHAGIWIVRGKWSMYRRNVGGMLGFSSMLGSPASSDWFHNKIGFS